MSRTAERSLCEAFTCVRNANGHGGRDIGLHCALPATRVVWGPARVEGSSGDTDCLCGACRSERQRTEKSGGVKVAFVINQLAPVRTDARPRGVTPRPKNRKDPRREAARPRQSPDGYFFAKSVPRTARAVSSKVIFRVLLLGESPVPETVPELITAEPRH